MRISVLCTDPHHPVMPYLKEWQARFAAKNHEIDLIHDKSDLSHGEILFLVSCSQIIESAQRERYRSALVLHASDLPRGRGWSPHVWTVVRGQSEITVCLLEAGDLVDSGPVWLRKRFSLEGHELLAEINAKLFAVEVYLMSEAVERFGQIEPQAQRGDPGEYLRKRTPQDSRLDPHKTFAEQFDLLRVVDGQRYPAFVEYRGRRYLIRIEKDDK